MGWIITAVILTVVGVAFHRLRLYEVMIRYNQMDDENKEDAQVKPISNYIALNVYCLAGLAFLLFVTSIMSWAKLYDALFLLTVIVFFWSLIDIPRNIRLIKDEAAQPIKLSKRNYLKLVRLLSSIGVMLAFFVYLLLK